MIPSARSTTVRCSRTLTGYVLPGGSAKADMLTAPFRVYSESVKRSFPEIIDSGSLASPRSR